MLITAHVRSTRQGGTCIAQRWEARLEGAAFLVTGGSDPFFQDEVPSRIYAGVRTSRCSTRLQAVEMIRSPT